MVETYQYPSEWRNNLKKGMIHSLYESFHCWKRTSIKHIQLIVNQDVKVLVKKCIWDDTVVLCDQKWRKIRSVDLVMRNKLD